MKIPFGSVGKMGKSAIPLLDFLADSMPAAQRGASEMAQPAMVGSLDELFSLAGGTADEIGAAKSLLSQNSGLRARFDEQLLDPLVEGFNRLRMAGNPAAARESSILDEVSKLTSSGMKQMLSRLGVAKPRGRSKRELLREIRSILWHTGGSE